MDDQAKEAARLARLAEQHGKLERPYVRVDLIRDLGAGKDTYAELGRRYGVTSQAIKGFERRHVERIDLVRSHLDDQFAGIAYADKRQRLEFLGGQVTAVADMLADPAGLLKAGVARAEMERVAQTALRGIAEELGQLPQRMSVQVAGRLDVAVNGVDVADLK